MTQECKVQSRIFNILLLLIFSTISISSSFCKEKPLWKLTPREFFASPKAQQIIDVDYTDHYVLSISIYHATNELRRKKGLEPLTPMRVLHDAGSSHLRAMKEYNFFAHVNPIEPDERTLRQRIEKRGGDFNLIGENLAQVLPMRSNGQYLIQYENNTYKYFDKKGRKLQLLSYGELGKYIVEQWYNSKGHRKNLLNPDYRYIGIATLIDKVDKNGRIPKIYAVQEFGA